MWKQGVYPDVQSGHSLTSSLQICTTYDNVDNDKGDNTEYRISIVVVVVTSSSSRRHVVVIIIIIIIIIYLLSKDIKQWELQQKSLHEQDVPGSYEHLRQPN